MAEKKISKPAEETIKFLGQEATKVVRSDGTISVRMKKDPYKVLLEKEGLTDEVLNKTSTGLQNICSAAVEETKNICKKHKGATVDVQLGSGPFSQEIRFIGKKEFNGHNPTTGEAIHKVDYGVVTAKVCMPWGKSMKGEDGQLAKIQKEMDDFFNKKK